MATLIRGVAVLGQIGQGVGQDGQGIECGCGWLRLAAAAVSRYFGVTKFNLKYLILVFCESARARARNVAHAAACVAHLPIGFEPTRCVYV